MSRPLKIFLALVLILVVAAFALPALPPNEVVTTRAEFCLLCGALRQGRDAHAVEEAATLAWSYYDKPLHTWYVDHFGDACPHRWQILSESHQCYRKIGPVKFRGTKSIGDRLAPRLLLADSGELADLDTRYAASPAECKRFIEEQLERK